MNRKEALLLELLDSEDPSLREIYLESFSVDTPSLPLLNKVVAMARHDPSERVRIAAIQTLVRFWPEPSVVETFTEVLLSGHTDLASAAVKAMTDLDDFQAIKLLCDTYNSRGDFRTKGAVLLVLDRRPFSLVRDFMLTVPLNDPDEFLRAMAVTAVSKKGDPAVITALRDRIADVDARVRANAVEGLGRFCHLLPQQLFIDLLGDANHRVQTAALKVLFRLGWDGIDRHLDRMAHSSIGLFRESAAYFLREVQGAGELPCVPAIERLVQPMPAYAGAAIN